MPATRCTAILLLALLAIPAPALHAATVWTIEEGSAIRFTALQQGAPVEGGFERFAADIAFDPEDLEASRIAVEIDVASVATGHGDRDLTLRSPAFFDVATWPSARFESDAITRTGDGSYAAEGRLTIRDVTRAVTLPFTLAIGDHPDDAGLKRAEATGALTIARLDYGVGQGEWAATTTVGDEVVIQIAIVATAPR